jgi:hypothetical protein
MKIVTILKQQENPAKKKLHVLFIFFASSHKIIQPDHMTPELFNWTGPAVDTIPYKGDDKGGNKGNL